MSEAVNDTELDKLANQAASITEPPLGEGTTDLDAAAAAGQVQPAVSNAQVLAGALAGAREAFCAFTKLESPRVTLSDDNVQQLGALWGPVFDKHGWNLSKAMGDHALEFTAVIGTIGIVMAVRSGLQAELADRKKAEPQEAPAADPAAPQVPDAGPEQ